MSSCKDVYITCTGQLTVSGPDALEKAKLTSEIIWERLKKAGIVFDDKLTEFLGFSSCHGEKIGEFKSFYWGMEQL